MPDILASAQNSTTPPLLPVRADVDLPYSSHASSLPPEPEPEPAVPPPVGKKNRGSKSLIMAVLLFLLATLPLSVYFTSQQHQLNDMRGRAQEGPYDRGCTPASVSPLDTGGRSCCDGTKLRNGICETTTTTTSSTTTCTCDICNLAGSTGPGTCTSGIKQAARPGCAATASQCAGTTTSTSGTPITTLAPGTNQCQNGEQNRDQGSWLICECANGCSYKTDTTEGSGGSGWVCDQNCRTVPAGTRPSGACTQIDWVHSGSSNYCGVAEINCPESCQTGGTTTTTTGGTTTTTTTTNPTATPIPTPTPTPVPGGTCELIKVYDAAGADITLAVRNGTKKLAIGEQITIATTKGNATKARFRIQGIADWAENDPAKTTATEYRLSINIPSTLTQSQGTFEVEVFVNGVWK